VVVIKTMMSLSRNQFLLLIVCGGSQLSDAMELVVLPLLRFVIEDFERGEGEISASGSTLSVSLATFVGMALGGPAWGLFADKYGRKAGTRMNLLWTGTFGLLCALVSNETELVVLRWFVGIGVGGASCALSWITEVLPKHKKKEFLVLFFVAFSLGGCVCAVLAWLCLDRLKKSWRLFLALCSLPAFVFSFLAGFFPESPEFLRIFGRLEEMNDSRNFYCGSYEPLSPNDGEDQDQEEMHERREPESPWQTAILAFLFFMMAIIYYALLELSVDLIPAGSQQFLGIAIVNFAELPGLAMLFMLNKMHYVKTSIAIMFSICGTACTLIIFDAGIFLLWVTRFSAIGFNQGLWIYSSLYFPSNHRAFGVGFVTTAARVGSMISPFLAFAGNETSSMGICALSCFVCAFSALFMLPKR